MNGRRAWGCAMLALGILAAFLVALFRYDKASTHPQVTEWRVYSADAIAKNNCLGKQSAVLFYARWALSADPKGGLFSTAIDRALSDADYVAMSADLTDSSVEDFDALKEQGFESIPVLVLYPRNGQPIGFEGGTPESQIIGAIEKLGRSAAEIHSAKFNLAD